MDAALASSPPYSPSSPGGAEIVMDDANLDDITPGLIHESEDELEEKAKANQEQKLMVRKAVIESSTAPMHFTLAELMARRECTSVRNGHTGTDDGCPPPKYYDDRSTEAGGHTETALDAVSRWEESERRKKVMRHPGPIVARKNIAASDLRWRDIGSGTFAKTILNTDRLITTTNSGPPLRDIAKRTIWCLKTGKMLDECIMDDTPDDCLHRKLDMVTDIRVEVEVKGSLDIFKSIGSDIVELYSQPRVAQEATAKRREGVDLIPGWSFDLTKADPQTGKPWDLSNEKIQSRVKKIIAENRPLFVIGSPPCTPFSVLQNINKGRRCPKVVAQELDLGKKHMKFCIEIYNAQVKEGRFFIHEHPKSATSWSMPEIVEVLAVRGVDVAEVDLCAYGLKTVKNGKEGPAKKAHPNCKQFQGSAKEDRKKVPGMP